MRIDIPIAEWPTCGSPNDEHVAALRERLSTTPTKDPEEISQILAARSARTALLHKLELETKTARAHRASELVKENRARKLRMEATAVARASLKLEKASSAVDARRQERLASREAAAARRDSLFAAVRTAREGRQLSREARLKELAQLEQNAMSLREKKLQTTVDRSSAQVKHALEVAASLKEKEATATAAAAARLSDRLSAAESRRQDVLSATVETAASVGQAADKIRLRHLQDEKATTEERKLRLARAMDKALGRRAGKIESIASRAAAENARISDVAAESRLQATTLKPATRRHAMTARLQAAEVNRISALKSKTTGVVRVGPSVRAAEATSPDASPDASPREEASGTAPWSGLSKAIRMHKPAPVIVISTEGFHSAAAAPPSERLLNRLNFRPRMLLATAPARHMAAAGRRATYLALHMARAKHFGTVRVAIVRGRRAALAEFKRSLVDLAHTKASTRAVAHRRAKSHVAAGFNERVTAAKLRRSNHRLRILNAAIAAEEKRLCAASKRDAALDVRRAGRCAATQAFAVGVRRAASSERQAERGAFLAQRCREAWARRARELSSVVSRAKLSAMPRQVPVQLSVTPSLTHPGLELTMTLKIPTVANPAVTNPTVTNLERSSRRPVSFIESPFCTKAEYSHWLALPAAQQQEALQKQLAGAAPQAPQDGQLQITDGDAIQKAAQVSSACAARAEERAEAKAAAKVAAEGVKKALEEASATAGLHGRNAKLAAAAKAKEAKEVLVEPTTPEPTPGFSSKGSSVASSEEWVDVN